MSDPQAFAQFPGVQAILSGSFTMNHGISPAAMQLKIMPQTTPIARVGPLLLTYDDVQIVLEDCLCDASDYEYNEAGEVVSLTLLDRRWKWQYGRTSGHFNIRTEDGKIIKKKNSKKGDILEDTEKTPLEMIELFLKDMGEKEGTALTAGFPNDARPLFERDNELPARALQWLCDQFGWRVTLTLDRDNPVRLVKEGQGDPLDKTLPYEHLTTTIRPAVKPSKLVILCNHTRYQGDFTLVAVGLDIDGSIKLLKDLSYWPKGLDPATVSLDALLSNIVADQKVLVVALASIGKWFQIKTPFDFFSIVHDGTTGQKLEIKNLSQVLPIENKQARTNTVVDVPVDIPAEVYGVWLGGNVNTRSGNNTDKLIADIKTGLKDSQEYNDLLVPLPFNIDEKFGIVKFEKVLVKQTGNGDTAKMVLPDLRLRCALSARDPDHGTFIRQEFSRELTEFIPTPGSETQPRYDTREEMTLVVISDQNNTVQTNFADLQKEANYYLDELQKQYTKTSPQSAQYVGWFPIEPTGTIQSVNWTFGEDDGGTTIVHFNDDPGTPEILPYKLRRQQELNKEAGVQARQMVAPSVLRRLMNKAR